MYLLLQICLLLVVSIALTSFATTKKIALILSSLFGLFFAAQIASILLGGSLMDYKFFVHLNADVSQVQGFFTTQIVLTLISLIISSFIIYYLSRKWRFINKINNKINYFAVPLCFIIMSLEGGIVNNIYNVANLNLASEKEFFQALTDLGITPADYKLPQEIKASSGKNIIVISIESLEKGFLSDQLAHLTPNLRRMAKEMTFFEMTPAEGSDWTAGSIYTEITGFPSFFKCEVNNIFQTSFDTKVTGLGHILNAAGYNVTYMLGGSEFAGVGDMLRTHNFKVKSDNDFSEKYPLTMWGIHDKDLFKEAKKELLTAKESNSPFALFMSTVSTHHPDGIYDSRMKGLVNSQKSELEFMVASVDYLIGDLYDFLKKENMLENTSIYLFPDHLLMGQVSRVLNDIPSPRSLYIITNAPEDKLSYSTKDKVLQIDIPKIILEGAEVKHNAKFLTEFLQDKDKLEFIKQNKSNILAFNESSLRTETYKNGFTIEFTESKDLCIKSSHHTDSIKEIKGDDVLCELSFDNNMRLVSAKIVEKTDIFNQKSDNIKLLINVKNENIYAYLKKGEILGIAKQNKNKVDFTKEDINLFSEWELGTKLSPSLTYASPYNSELIYLTSTSGLNTTREFPPTEIRIGSTEHKISRGINLLSKEGAYFKVENFDTFNNFEETQSFIKRLKSLRRNKEFYALLVHDSGENQLQKFGKELRDLGFHKLATLGFREAYIGYSIKGYITEYRNKNTLSLSFPQQFPKSLRSDAQIDKDAKDVYKFIAHAGGIIQGCTYTNTLDALNSSYEKGFRLFELDIIKTSDGKYVAAHDWESWAKQTEYKGSLPPTSSDFIKHKIHGKFTLLDLEAINKWFKDHKDAILITDKVNEPKLFSEQFVDKNRLMMELFSLDAVKEGIAVGIKSAMLSENILASIPGDKVGFLKNLNVKHVCVSRRMIEGNTEFFLKLKENNIKVYAFHVNYRIGIDEAYMLLNEMDLVYGIYADDWHFGK